MAPVPLCPQVSPAYRVPHIWSLVPENLMNAPSFEIFKNKLIGKMKCKKCPCGISKIYIQQTWCIWIKLDI